MKRGTNIKQKILNKYTKNHQGGLMPETENLHYQQIYASQNQNLKDTLQRFKIYNKGLSRIDQSLQITSSNDPDGPKF